MLELRVMTATTEYVYTSDDGLLAGDEAEIREAIEGSEVTLGDIRLSLGSPFLGAASRQELPAVSVAPRVASGAAGGGYRAVLRRDGVGVLDGVIPRAELALDRQARSWSVPLVAGSADDLWTRLEKVRLGDMLQSSVDALVYHTIASARRTTTPPLAGMSGGVRYEESGSHRWYQLTSVLTAVLAEAGRYGVGASGVALEDGLPVLRHEVRHVSSVTGDTITETPVFQPLLCSTALYDEAAGYTRTSLTLPDWSGRELAEAALAALGWRMVVRYAAYPSTDLVVRVQADVWQEQDPAALVALDERVAEGGLTERLSRSGSSGSFALRLAGPPRPATPPVEAATNRTTEVVVWSSLYPAPPPPEALLAPDSWSFEPTARESEPAPTAEQVVDVPFLLPEIAVTVSPEPEYPSGSRFSSGLPLVEAVGPWLAVAAGGGRLLHHRFLLYPAPGQRPMVNPVWAYALYSRRELSRQPLEAVVGSFYVHGLDVAVGDAVTWGGLDWVVREQRRRLSDDHAELDLVRPAAVAPSGAARPARTGLVRRLRATTTRASSVGWIDVVLSWEPPLLEQADVMRYEVEQTGGAPPASFMPPPPPIQLHTAFRYLGPSADAGPWFRVRAIGSAGPGPWTEIEAPWAGQTNEQAQPGAGAD